MLVLRQPARSSLLPPNTVQQSHRDMTGITGPPATQSSEESKLDTPARGKQRTRSLPGDGPTLIWSIPRELRDQIYELVCLTGQQGVPSYPHLVCKQMAFETERIYNNPDFSEVMQANAWKPDWTRREIPSQPHLPLHINHKKQRSVVRFTIPTLRTPGYKGLLVDAWYFEEYPGHVDGSSVWVRARAQERTEMRRPDFVLLGAPAKAIMAEALDRLDAIRSHLPRQALVVEKRVCGELEVIAGRVRSESQGL